MRRDRLLWLLLAVFLLYLIGLWAASLANARELRADLKVTVYDAVAPPGSEFEAIVKVEEDGPSFVNPDQHDLPLVIGLHAAAEDQTSGESPDDSADGLPGDDGPEEDEKAAGPAPPTTREARTAGDGLAKATFRAPERPGRYRLFAQPVASELTVRPVTEPPLLFVIPADRRLLVCDLDDTVTHGGWNVVTARPQEGAAAALHELAKRFGIIYLTARDEGLLNRTRAWLAEHGFPRAPVLCRDWHILSPTRTASDKTRALRELRRTYPGLAWGIGNSKYDRAAYTELGIPHIILGIGEPTPAENGTPRHRASSWQEVLEIIEAAERPREDL